MNFYANGLNVTFSEECFCIEFTFTNPNGGEESICIVLSPKGVKTLNKALTEQLGEYEREFGEVEPWEKPREREGNGYYIG